VEEIGKVVGGTGRREEDKEREGSKREVKKSFRADKRKWNHRGLSKFKTQLNGKRR
jgi:hypothetical protein